MDTQIITGGLVVTLDAARAVISDGAVVVRDGRIAAVGTAAEHAATPGTRIDAAGMIVLPGLIDAHAHAGHCLVKTLGGGDGARWTQAVEEIYPRGSTPEFWAADGALAALERLRAGITTGLAIFGAYGSRTDDAVYAEAHAAAYARVGVRLVLCPGVSPPPFPNRFRRTDGSEHAVGLEEQLAVCDALIGLQSDATRIMLAAPVGTTPDYLDVARQVRALSRSRGVGFTQDGHRAGTVRAAHAAGLLGPDALLSHCIDLEPDEIEAIIETRTKVAHNPSANFSIIGRCPAIELMQAGATVAICSDGTAPDRPFDLFRHMQQAMHYHRRYFRDAKVLPPGKALEMVTIDAARALGLDAEIGSLEVGKRADVTLVDIRKAHLYPPDMPLYRLVAFANAADVDTVMVGGRILMAGRAIRHVEEGAILDDAAREIGLALDRTGLRGMAETPAGFWRGTHYDS